MEIDKKEIKENIRIFPKKDYKRLPNIEIKKKSIVPIIRKHL